MSDFNGKRHKSQVVVFFLHIWASIMPIYAENKWVRSEGVQQQIKEMQ